MFLLIFLNFTCFYILINVLIKTFRECIPVLDAKTGMSSRKVVFLIRKKPQTPSQPPKHYDIGVRRLGFE